MSDENQPPSLTSNEIDNIEVTNAADDEMTIAPQPQQSVDNECDDDDQQMCPIDDGLISNETTIDNDTTAVIESKNTVPVSTLADVDFPKDRKHRVKLYVLNDERSWDDKGTGHVACILDPEPPEALYLTVRSETDNSDVLKSKIKLNTGYQIQQETLIVWSESDSYNLALSFQEKSGCEEIWEKICQVQGKDPSSECTQEVSAYDNDNDADSELNDSASSATSAPTSGSSVQLPPCEIARLHEIENLFATCLQSPVRRENLALAIEAQNYISKLCDMFRTCEDLENIESLKLIYQIVKNMFMLNKNSVLEIMFNDRHLKDIVGMLEYDPSLSEPKHHRDFLFVQASLKEVIPIKSPTLKAKIHQTYRVQYIQDVILPAPSIFEENMLSSLTSYIFFNRVEIVAMIQDDDNFLQTLFTELRSKETNVVRQKDLTLFLKDFCTFAQTLQQNGPQGREAFFKTLMSHGVLSAVEECLLSKEQTTRAATIEVFAMIVDYSPQLARDYLLAQDKNSDKNQDDLLVNQLVDQLFNDPDPELSTAMQILHILRLLVDPDNMMTASASKAEKAEFLSFFYKRGAMSNLCKLLMENTIEKRPAKDDYHTAHKLSLVLEMLCFCFEHHSLNIRQFCISRDLIRRVLVLLKSQHAFLALGALRLFRRIVQLKDDFYYRHIIKQNLFEPIVECFRANGRRYNLMNSALLELFEFIRTDDIKSLIYYVSEQHANAFDNVDYVKTFSQLKLRYDQHRDREKDMMSKMATSATMATANTPPPVWKREQREIDRDEQDWFEDDEEWEDGKLSPSSAKTPPIADETELSPNNSLPNSPTTSAPVPSSKTSTGIDENVITPTLKRLNEHSQSSNFPSVVKRKADDDGVGVFSPVPQPSKSTSLSSRTAATRIVIKMSTSPTSPSNLDATATTTTSSLSPPGDSVVSSTELTPPNSTSSTVILKSITGGLVDYDFGDSDSDEEDAPTSSSTTIRVDEIVVATTTVAETDDTEDVSSTSGDHEDEQQNIMEYDDDEPSQPQQQNCVHTVDKQLAQQQPLKKRLKLDDDDVEATMTTH